MLKGKTFENWQKLNDMWNELVDNYYNFSQEFKNKLHDNCNIDDGHSYADYIFNVGNIDY